jgi:predicted transcriptional regulator
LQVKKRQIQEGNTLVKPDMRIVEKILRSLLRGKMKKTPLSMKIRKNYNECFLYLTFLETLEFVKNATNEDGDEVISITGRGREYYRKHFVGKHNSIIDKTGFDL